MMGENDKLAKNMKAFESFNKKEHSQLFVREGIERYKEICRLIYEGNINSAPAVLNSWLALHDSIADFVDQHSGIDDSEFREIITIGMMGSMHANASFDLYSQPHETEQYKKQLAMMERAIEKQVRTSFDTADEVLAKLGIDSNKGKGAEL